MSETLTLNNLKQKFIVRSTLLTLAMGWGGYALFQSYLPESYPALYPLIPLYFFFYGIAFIYVYEKLEKRRTEALMVNKVVKLLLSLVFVLVYAQCVGTFVKPFMFTFLGYYFVYLIFESIFFLQYEMTLKKNKR
jgi:hypothetical protein